MRAEPKTIATIEDARAIEARPISEQWSARTVFEMLSETARAHPRQPAISFQLRGDAKEPGHTLDWAAFRAEVAQIANLYRDLGLKRGEVVALLMPNLPEMASAMVAAMTAGVAAPINPLLEPEQIAAILRETGAKMLVTLKPFVKTDIAAKAAEAVRFAPDCRLVLEVGLGRYLKPPMAWIAPLLAPKRDSYGSARVLGLRKEMARMRADGLDFVDEDGPDDVCGYFHTGGTTGAPKVAVHRHRGAIYNGWLVDRLLLGPRDSVLCPLPLFHVLAAYPMLMACIASGCHFVMPTPAGYRGPGVMDNFWKLVERWDATFICTVPTAVSALMQRPVDADVSKLNYALCGSAPMPPELFRRFEEASGVKILEGYGQTETTCLISCNPPEGERKIGSVGLPLPYTEVRILKQSGGDWLDCETDEIGEICVSGPGNISGYLEGERNSGLFAGANVIRTGDLGRVDADGYLWITGRAKDLIIRGGHNIDPGAIEDALLAHPAVAFAGAVGQPDGYAGELPCVYVELSEGAAADADALRAFAAEHVNERAARPVFVEVMDELPKTAVGKVFKPALRKRAIERVFEAALREQGCEARVRAVDDDRLGIVAEIRAEEGDLPDAARAALDAYPTRWRVRSAEAA